MAARLEQGCACVVVKGPLLLPPLASPLVPGAHLLPGRRERLIGLLLFVGFLALFFCVQRAQVPSYDGKIMYSVTKSIVDRGSLTTGGGDPFGFNTPYAVYGIGTSLLLIPGYALQRLLGTPDDVYVTMMNPLVLAATGVLVYRLGRALRWPHTPAIWAALMFGYLTMVPQASTELFSEPGVTFGTVLAALGIVRWRDGAAWAPWAAGVGIAVAILFRTDSIPLVGVAVLALPMFVPWRRLRSAPWRLAGLVLPVLAVGVWLLAYNALRFGSPLESRYDGGGFTTPFFEGLRGLLVSPGKSFFLFNLILLLALPGFVLLWKRDRAAAVLLGLLSISRPLFYASWHAWEGGIAWGPRFLLPMSATLAIPAAMTLRSLPSIRSLAGVASRLAVAVLVVASSVVVVASVWVPYEQWWGRITYVGPEVPERERPRVAGARVHDFLWTFEGGHINGNLTLLDESAIFPLRHFTGGPSTKGSAALVVAVAAPALALALGRRREESSEAALDEPGDRERREVPV